MKRIDGRLPSELRPLSMEMDFVKTADGSCLISAGKTRVICTASIEDDVPHFLRGTGSGWVTAEYAMLPASTGRRKIRDGIKKDGRSVEIQRLIGRSLRQALDLSLLGERMIMLDCDVLQADGGTRTASITGAYAALVMAVNKLLTNGLLSKNPIIGQIAAISAGLIDDVPMLDLCYAEDSAAQTDMNVVMNQKGEFIELQGTGEGRAFTTREMEAMLGHSRSGLRKLMQAQRAVLAPYGAALIPAPRLLAATANTHKLKELSHIFQGICQVVGMAEIGLDMEIDENGNSFEKNAAIKAEAVMRATGLPALADDSGLSVHALGGAPGIHSARYAGEHGMDGANNALLLQNMSDITDRRCKFVCAMALALPGEQTRTVLGECEGTLLDAPRGEGGFGYDPLFLYNNDKTFAELSEKEKNKISHRARAAEQMRSLLLEVL